MDEYVQQFKDKQAERAVAKQAALEALATATDRDDPAIWDEVKAFDAELQAIASDYVADHPEQFVTVKDAEHEALVKLISLMSSAGMEEENLRLTMYELAKFDRQTIGATPQATIRLGFGG